MYAESVVRAVVNDLKTGVIQEWQVRESLERRNVPSFYVEKLNKEILEKYHNEQQLEKVN